MPAAQTESSAPSLTTDVAIVGGGMVGMTLAIALGQSGLSVAVLDRADPADYDSEPYDGRASAVAHGSAVMLKGLGLWTGPTDDSRIDTRACRIDDIRVSDGSSRLFLHYDHLDLNAPSEDRGDAFVPLDSPPMGYIVENRAIRRALLARLTDLPTVSFLAPAALADDDESGITMEPGKVTLRLSDGRRVHAALLVGADGVRSAVRSRAGIHTAGWEYDQVGIVCTARFPKPHRNVAHERFLPAGPFALLPMVPEAAPPAAAPHRASIVWTERKDHARAMLALDDRAFGEEMTRRFGPSLGPLSIAGRRWSYPLGVMHVERTVGPRLALVGDAAHRIHPIAGQGLNLGLRDVAALAEVLVDAARIGRDPGDTTVLERYQRWRRFDTMSLIAATDGLNRLFSTALPPVRLVRDLGLAMVDRIGPLKRVFMRHAMGELGDLPRLIRGGAL